MKKPLVILILMLLAVVLSAGCIQEPENPKPQLYPMPPVPDDYIDYPHAGSIDNEETYFTGLNEHYNLGLTDEEIQKYAKELRNGYLKDAKRDEYYVHINDLVEFQTVVTQMINLDPAIHEEIVQQILTPPEFPEQPVEYVDPNDPTLPDDYFYTFVPNTETYLNHRLNEGYGLGFNKEEIAACAEELNNGILKDAKPHKYGLYVENEIELWLEVVRIMNLSDDIRDQYIKALCTIPPDIVY